MPMAKAGMLFMKKLAKCSAATTISASGRVARMSSPMRCNAPSSAWRALGVGALGAGGDAGGVAAGAAIDQRHQCFSRSRFRRASCASTPS